MDGRRLVVVFLMIGFSLAAPRVTRASHLVPHEHIFVGADGQVTGVIGAGACRLDVGVEFDQFHLQMHADQLFSDADHEGWPWRDTYPVLGIERPCPPFASTVNLWTTLQSGRTSVGPPPVQEWEVGHAKLDVGADQDVSTEPFIALCRAVHGAQCDR